MAPLDLPLFARYPTSTEQRNIPPQIWNQSIESWSTLAGLYSRIPTSQLTKNPQCQKSAINFLVPFFTQLHSSDHPRPFDTPTANGTALRKNCFLLVSRLLLDTNFQSNELLTWEFLSDFAHAFTRTRSLCVLLQRLWSARPDALVQCLAPVKAGLIESLQSSSATESIKVMTRSIPLIHASPYVGAFFMTGSDLIDALTSTYTQLSTKDVPHLVVFTYLCLSSLYKSGESNHALLIDTLYSLQAQAGSPSGPANLLHDLVTNTPLLDGINRAIVGKHATRAAALIDKLQQFHMQSIARARRQSRPKMDNGKGKELANDDDNHRIHRMSLITQIQDLFPDLGSGFVAQLLDAYNDDVEVVTAHLLENSLPEHLKSLDRSTNLPEPGLTASQAEQQNIEQLAHVEPHLPITMNLPQRRNVFDDDEFDRLEVDASRLRIGKQKAAGTDDEDEGVKPNKVAIMAALAAFDSDDDERDDTYDDADVGDTVDAARPDGEDSRDVRVSTRNGESTASDVDAQVSANDRTLFSVWKENSELLGRSADTRRSQARTALRNETGMTDEMIEGWAVMIARDTKMQKRLETAGQSTFDGSQTMLERTSYRYDGDDTGTDSDRPHASDRGRGGRGRGRGRGRGQGRGARGTTSGPGEGPSHDPDSAIARQRKDQNKASRGNHNRREQRGKKMARAGLPG